MAREKMKKRKEDDNDGYPYDLRSFLRTKIVMDDEEWMTRI